MCRSTERLNEPEIPLRRRHSLWQPDVGVQLRFEGQRFPTLGQSDVVVPDILSRGAGGSATGGLRKLEIPLGSVGRSLFEYGHDATRLALLSTRQRPNPCDGSIIDKKFARRASRINQQPQAMTRRRLEDV